MKKELKIYLIHPISGLTYEQVNDYYRKASKLFSDMGYTVFHPMTGKKQLRPEVEYKAHGIVGNPVATNHAIFERDNWMIQTVDMVYADLLGCKNVSIGSCMELAVAAHLRKHSVAVIDKDNPHMHAFVLEAVDTLFEVESDAMQYFRQLIDDDQYERQGASGYSGIEGHSGYSGIMRVAYEGYESIMKMTDDTNKPEVPPWQRLDGVRAVASSALRIIKEGDTDAGMDK